MVILVSGSSILLCIPLNNHAELWTSAQPVCKLAFTERASECLCIVRRETRILFRVKESSGSAAKTQSSRDLFHLGVKIFSLI